MRIIAKLPDKKHFKPFGRSERWPYIWEAICSPKVRLCSPVANPWEINEWSIRVRESKGKSDKTEYVNRIDFQLFEKNDSSIPLQTDQNAFLASIVWEVDKGISHSNQPTLRFYSIPFINSQEQEVSLMLSIVEKKNK